MRGPVPEAVNDADVAVLTGMGFTPEQAVQVRHTILLPAPECSLSHSRQNKHAVQGPAIAAMSSLAAAAVSSMLKLAHLLLHASL